MKKKSKLIITSTLSMICLCVLGVFIPAVTARDSFAPSWLNEGVYMTYYAKNEGDIRVFNADEPRFEGLNYLYTPVDSGYFDWIRHSGANLTWKCDSVNSTMAKLQVTFDYIGERLDHYEGAALTRTSLNGESFQRTGVVYVDLYTRAVYNVDGVLLGTTHLWLPANPSGGQKLVVWDVESKTITLPVTLNRHQTIQGTQEAFMFMDDFKLVDSDPSSSKHMGMFYDLETGLATGGVFDWDPIFAAIGLESANLAGDNGENAVLDTNIKFGTTSTTINLTQILQYAILPIAVVLLLVAFVIRRKKRGSKWLQ